MVRVHELKIELKENKGIFAAPLLAWTQPNLRQDQVLLCIMQTYIIIIL